MGGAKYVEGLQFLSANSQLAVTTWLQGDYSIKNIDRL
jgi:hypothetical protein